MTKFITVYSKDSESSEMKKAFIIPIDRIIYISINIFNDMYRGIVLSQEHTKDDMWYCSSSIGFSYYICTSDCTKIMV